MSKKKLLAVCLATVLAVSGLSACGDKDHTPASAKGASGKDTSASASQTMRYVITANNLNVRSGPGGDRAILGQLSRGTEVEILGVEDGWCRILYQGKEAYISAEFVAAQNGASATVSASATTTQTEVTSTTPTKTQAPTQPSVSYTDRYIDNSGMLQFKPGNNYVQAGSYADGAIPWNLMLINDWNPMKEGYDEAVTMKAVASKYAQVNGGQKVDARMYDDLVAMLEAGKAYNIGVQSSYRPYATQKRLYWAQVEKWKSKYSDPVVLQTKAGEVVKRPGFSEHNTGLAVDLYGSGNTSLSPSFANTAAYKWLMEHCADYGFILRFPKGKEGITGVIYEAWHFRYVGDAAIAHEIMDNNLCLEEYLQQTGR